MNRIKFFKSKCIAIDLPSLLKSNISIPSPKAKKEILKNLNNRKWGYPFPLIQNIENNPNDVPIENASVSLENYECMQTSPKWQDYQFIIKGIFVNVRKFDSGMISVNSTYNPEIIAMLKEWKREGLGSYNPKYKSWNYWLPFSNIVLERLEKLNQ